MNFKQISMIMLVILLASPVIASIDEVLQATTDAEQDAENDVSMIAWGSGGFVCSGFAVLYAYFSTPQVPTHKLLGKSPTYITAYTTAYQQNVKNRRTRATVMGCGLASGIAAVANLTLIRVLR